MPFTCNGSNASVPAHTAGQRLGHEFLQAIVAGIGDHAELSDGVHLKENELPFRAPDKIDRTGVQIQSLHELTDLILNAGRELEGHASVRVGIVILAEVDLGLPIALRKDRHGMAFTVKEEGPYLEVFGYQLLELGGKEAFGKCFDHRIVQDLSVVDVYLILPCQMNHVLH